MEATKERREQERKAADADAAAGGGGGGSDSVQLPTETSPYVRYNKDDGLEDYKMRAYGARGHLPVSDLPHGGTGTDAPTVPGTALPAAGGATTLQERQPPQREGGKGGGGAGSRVGDTATDTINRHGVP